MSRFTLLPPATGVFSAEHAREVATRLRACRVLAVDTETTGLSRPRDRAIIVAISDGRDRYAIWPDAIPVFQELLEDKSITLVMHNANYDCWMLRNIGIDVYRNCARREYRVHDSMVMHHLVNSEAAHSLKVLAKSYLKIEMESFQKTFDMRSESETETALMDPANREKAVAYASLDAYATLKLYYKLKKELLAVPSKFGTMWDYFLQHEAKLTKVLYYMERAGVRIDTGALSRLIPVFEQELVEIQAWFAKSTNQLLINLGSTAQMQNLFFNTLGRKPVSFTATGAPSLTASVLQGWEDDCEYAEKLLRYREVDKQLGTYVLGILGLVTSSGRIHASFNQNIARTGRLSSSDPNLQNQHPRIREAFVADDDCILRASDYGQLEMRILAHRSGERALVLPIREGRDLHSATASVMFNVTYDVINAAKVRDDGGLPPLPGDSDLLKKRKAAKAINFGLLYGQGARKLAKTLGVHVDEAKGLIKNYFTALPKVNKHLAHEIATARENGFCTTILGRRRPLPGYLSLVPGDVAAAERKTKNTPIQGSAAEVVAAAMIKIFESTLLESAGIEQLIQVHDEILFSIPARYKDDLDLLREIDMCMEHPLPEDLIVPLGISTKYGNNWLACK